MVLHFPQHKDDNLNVLRRGEPITGAPPSLGRSHDPRRTGEAAKTGVYPTSTRRPSFPFWSLLATVAIGLLFDILWSHHVL